jgi:hypothetical protein
MMEMSESTSVVTEHWLFDEETEERYFEVVCETCKMVCRGENPHHSIVREYGRDAAERLVAAGTRYMMRTAGCPHVLRL